MVGFRTTMWCACVVLAACAGDGAGLDENGRPIGEEAQALEPTLASIQRNVFTPICTTCHAGASAPVGLRLDEGAAYAMLVNAPSVEAPSTLRVAPGDPDASYLVHKIEGTAAVGGRMPLNGPPLSAEAIAVIRQWIANGAAPASIEPVSIGPSKPAALTAAWPTAGAQLASPPDQILISADAALDAALLDAGVISLRASGGDGDFADGDEITLDAKAVVRALEPTVFAVTTSSPWVADAYELRLSGGAPLALADLAARPIDGDGDGVAGGDFVVRFRVETSR